MCGIFCCIHDNKLNHDCLQKTVIHNLLHNRGPNCESIIKLPIGIFASFILWHQGKSMCVQPVCNDDLVFLFNGDIYNFTTDTYNDKINDESDTKHLFKMIENCRDDMAIIELFRQIEGPFSIIIYKRSCNTLYFCRDSIGRSSLIVEKDTTHFRILSTTSINSSNAIELPSIGVFKLNLATQQHWTLFSWQQLDQFWSNKVNELEQRLGINVNYGDIIWPSWLKTQPFALEKVSFNFYDIIRIQPFTIADNLFELLLEREDILTALNTFSNLLEESVKLRVTKTTQYCSNCLNSRKSCQHAKIAVLFSGGLDSTLLAILADKFVNEGDSIDLINVAFEPVKSTIKDWQVPDRLSGKASLRDLQELCPKRTWNFIEVNVTRNELEETLTKHLKNLIYPLNTVLDESIGCALWFAARGKGFISSTEYISSARVIVIGSGADELFGGYIRHRNAYLRTQDNDLEKELSVDKELHYDWNRISCRNLARDDRVIADTGKTPRAPFLEEHLIKYVQTMNANQKCCFLLPDGVGDKLFLRLYAHKLGLKYAASLKKRAIQFGSKIAIKNQKASDLSIHIK